MPTLYPIGYGTRLVTLDELEDAHGTLMHPEYKRRLFPWIEGQGGLIGIGGGFRITQPARPGFAPDGKSFHQRQVFASGFSGYCAVDLVARNHGRVHRAPTWSEVPAQGNPSALVYGVHCNVGNESWHMQPIEIDGYDTWVRGGCLDPVAGYPIPGTDPPPAPTPPPPIPPGTTQESLMYTVFIKPNGGFCFGRLGEWYYHVATPSVKTAALAGGAIDLLTGGVVTTWKNVNPVPEATYTRLMGEHRGDNF